LTQLHKSTHVVGFITVSHSLRPFHAQRLVVKGDLLFQVL